MIGAGGKHVQGTGHRADTQEGLRDSAEDEGNLRGGRTNRAVSSKEAQESRQIQVPDRQTVVEQWLSLERLTGTLDVAVGGKCPHLSVYPFASYISDDRHAYGFSIAHYKNAICIDM